MRLNVEVREEWYRKLEVFAKLEDRTISEVVRSLILAWIKGQEAEMADAPVTSKEDESGRAE